MSKYTSTMNAHGDSKIDISELVRKSSYPEKARMVMEVLLDKGIHFKTKFGVYSDGFTFKIHKSTFKLASNGCVLNITLGKKEVGNFYTRAALSTVIDNLIENPYHYTKKKKSSKPKDQPVKEDKLYCPVGTPTTNFY